MLFLKLIRESLIFSFSSLVSNKLRTFLSLLGITIGIFAIIAVFTVLDSIERSIRDTISSLGDNVVYIQKWPWEFEGEYKWWKYLNRPVVTLQEFDEVMQRTDNVYAGAFMISTSTNVIFESTSIDDITLIASSYDYDKIFAFDLEKGRYFSSFEAKSGRNIAIVGHSIALTLFRNRNPIGKTIKLMGRKLTVVGVFAKEG
ncbi:MAG: ABC transporter permease, partial [Bacteroidetes bacterium]|nr:ABC transporter permease [Bacteroidota bacterium]